MVGRAGAAAAAVVGTTVVGGGILYAAWQWGWLASIGIPKPAPKAHRAREAAERARQAEEEGPNFSEGTGRQQFGYVGHQVGGPNLGAHRGAGRYAYLPNEPLRAGAGRQADGAPESAIRGAGFTQACNDSVMRRLFIRA